ncbi:hypothetical protein GCM10009555_047510 [Acrocarpospora macrocephala]|uniref:Uncharacterized protein n=1 Tax=Acrocarpospora macrocephala TaxID=150177 RepID=A0A5M3X055_9ACTN|nr:hypothetical protein [Acrocarpospora macrocephala]GES12093.1 hypothetical protein Amac_056900 [Acrocarpospora macrocephala]
MADRHNAEDLLAAHVANATMAALDMLGISEKEFLRALEETVAKRGRPKGRREDAEWILRALSRTFDQVPAPRPLKREAWHVIFAALLWGMFPNLSTAVGARRFPGDLKGGPGYRSHPRSAPETDTYRELMRIARDAGLPTLVDGGSLQDADFGTVEFLASGFDVRLARAFTDLEHKAKASKKRDRRHREEIVQEFYASIFAAFAQTAGEAIDRLKGSVGRFLATVVDPVQSAQFLLLKTLGEIAGSYEEPEGRYANTPVGRVKREALLAAELRVNQTVSSALSDPAPIVVMYLPNEESYPEVKQAIADLLDAFGMEILLEGGIVQGSVWQSFVAVFKRRITEEQADQALTKVQRAVELRGVDKPQADVTRTQSESVAQLLDSLKDNPSALIQIGNILVAKVNGVPIALELSQAQLFHLHANPTLYTDPARAVEQLSRIQGPPNTPADDPSLPGMIRPLH